MTLTQAVRKAKDYQHKVGSEYKGKIIAAIIPAPADISLFTPFVETFKRHMLYYKREEINFTKINTPIQAKRFEVFYLFEGALHTNTLTRSLDLVEQIMVEDEHDSVQQ